MSWNGSQTPASPYAVEAKDLPLSPTLGVRHAEVFVKRLAHTSTSLQCLTEYCAVLGDLGGLDPWSLPVYQPRQPLCSLHPSLRTVLRSLWPSRSHYIPPLSYASPCPPSTLSHILHVPPNPQHVPPHSLHILHTPPCSSRCPHILHSSERHTFLWRQSLSLDRVSPFLQGLSLPFKVSPSQLRFSMTQWSICHCD